MNPEAARLRRLVEENREEILRIAAKHHALSIRLFGSVVRVDAREGSDIDFLVRFELDYSLMDRIRLKLDLEDLLGVPVDLASESGLYHVIREDVLREAVPV